jgi:hypothetical protein
MVTWSTETNTLNAEKLEQRFHDVENLEARAAKRQAERAQWRQDAEQTKSNRNFLKMSAATVGLAMGFGLALAHYGNIHRGEPIHGPAIPAKSIKHN